MHPTKGGLPIPDPDRAHKQSLEVVERGVLLNLLSENRRWPLVELEQKIDSEHFEEAVTNLEDVGLLRREDDVIFATPAALRGDDLAL